MNKLRTARLLMAATVLLIIAFQAYWLRKLYQEETTNFKKSTDIIFRESMYRLQTQRFAGDSIFIKNLPGENLFMTDLVTTVQRIGIEGGDSIKKDYRISVKTSPETDFDTHLSSKNDSIVYVNTHEGTFPPIQVARILGKNKTVNDTIPVKRIDSMYSSLLAKEGILVKFHIIKGSGVQHITLSDSNKKMFTVQIDDRGSKNFSTKKVPVGFLNPVFYHAEFGDVSFYMFKKIRLQLFLSLFLIALTILSFVFIYRNLLAQKRLTEIKNEFIGNITHELKTPIATVSVAIEAMKNFDALKDPERTQEYLGIAGQELNRLSLLVDKVLRLSMFETQQVELKYEWFDVKKLLQEVISSMQLQFQKFGTKVKFGSNGEDFMMMADRMHITSVVYNLLDNALKYGKEEPEVDIHIEATASEMTLTVKDNGIGIPVSYKEKIFDKFFRVPHGDKHNVKGYGLGLSYTAHIIAEHKGSIKLESEEEKGTTFIIKLPKENAGS
ncbi:MAG: HAMP domain-containing sensor histidine kinase [Ferruginibacter sp.]